MKKIYYFFIAFSLSTFSIIAQSLCSTGRYSTDVFATVTRTNGIQYGQNNSFTGANTNLTLDFYQPTGDTAIARPLIVWAHGGSFLGGTSADVDMVNLCNGFAKKGFVCASINYRLGFFPVDSANSVKAVMRAVQDMKAAVRFFYKDRVTGANLYKIDTNNIFIGGSSAGAITALHYAYLDRTCEVNPYVPQPTLTTLGGLEGNSGNVCYSSRVKGVINLCGALARYGWLEQGNVPLCSMHGTNDNTVKYSRGLVNPGTPLMYLDGSRMLKERATAIGVQNTFYTFYNAPHVPYNGTSASQLAYMDTTIRFVRDFLIQQLGCTDPILQPANTPSGTATLYAYTPCTGNVAQTFCTVGIKEHYAANLVEQVFPNPSENEINLIFSSENKKHTVELLDVSGRVIKSYSNIMSAFVLAKNELAEGMYTLKVSDAEGNYSVHKVVFY